MLAVRVCYRHVETYHLEELMEAVYPQVRREGEGRRTVCIRCACVLPSR